LGFRVLDEALFLKAMYVSGRDDPALGANVGVTPSFGSRQGHVASLAEETKLFNGLLGFRAEIAFSSYDGDLHDTAGAARDTAWNAGTAFTLGPLRIDAIYRFIGRNFNSVGLQYLANDRRGPDATILFAAGPVSLQGQLTLLRDNVDEVADRPTTHFATGGVAAAVTVSPSLSLNLSGRISGQDTSGGTPGSPVQDAQTKDVSGGLNWTLGPTSSLNLTLTASDLRSPSNPASDTKGLTLNLGGSFMSERLIFTPTLGLTRSDNPGGAGKSTTVSAFVSGEVFVFSRVLSVLVSGAFNRMEMSVLSLTKTMDAVGGINFYPGRLFGVENLLLTIRGNYRTSDLGGKKLSDSRVLAQADIAF
jgi:hypothetical protein